MNLTRVALLATLATVLSAQQQADVSGVVKDTSGAPVPRAAIALLNQQSGVRRQAVSDASGVYAIPGARPGSYRISVRKEGFQTSARTGITLVNGQHARFDFTLVVGPVEQSVTVHDRQNSQPPGEGSASTTVERRMVENLPNNGRSLLPLIEAAPGVVGTPAGGGEAGQFSVNGQRTNTNYITVDGVGVNFAVNDGTQSPAGATPVLTALGGMQTVASVEALDEMRIRTSATPAEFGRLSGAQISLTTRSGSNRLHATLFEYLRNDKFDANNWFSNSAGLSRAVLRSNDFGAAFGGPLIRNKTYFFAAFEGLRLNQPFTLRDSVPSDGFRAQAPKAVQDFLAAYPRANGPATEPDQALLTANVSRRSQVNTASLRLDHTVKDRTQLFVRIFDSPSSAQGSASSLFSQGQLNLAARGVTLGLTSALSPNVVNDFRFGYALADARYGVVPAVNTSSGNVWSILPAVTPAEQSNYSVQVYGLQPVLLDNADRHSQSQWSMNDSLTRNVGKHEWKSGIDYRMVLPSIESRPWQVFASFDSLPSLALGQISQFTVSRTNPLALSARALSLYTQDTWRVRPNLSLNFGLRWEWNPPISGRGATLLQPVADLESPANAALAVGPLYRTNSLNFAPRAGFAWRPYGVHGMTVRGGAGLYYDLGYGAVMSGLANAAPNFISSTVYNASVYAPSGSFRLPSAAPPYASGFAYAPGYQTPFTLNWNAGVDQEIGKRAVLSAAYVSLDGNRLPRREWMSNLNASFTGVDVTTNAGFSEYRAVQVQLRSRMDSALQYLLSFSWARSVDNASRDSQLLPYGDAAARAADIGYSDFDVRRAWNASVSYEPKWSHGWGLESIVRGRTGFPVNVVTGADPFRFGLGNYVLRPNLIPGAQVWIPDPSVAGGERLNPAAFIVPSNYGQGDLVRNAVRGFGFAQADLAVRKTFNVSERTSAQFRIEAFNALNHPNPGDPQANLSSAQFGQSQSMLNAGLGTGGPGNGLMPVFQIGGPRSLQMSLRLRF